jgi:peroxiredoxin
LQAYQSILPDLQALGASLVSVSPQLPDSSLSMAEKNALEFEVLSDAGNAVARQFGLVWRYPEELRELYESFFKIVLPQINGDDTWELPLTATFVIGQDGVIRYAFVDPDYTKRAEPSELLDAVRTA